MSYQLNTDQMLDALIYLDHPRADGWKAQLEALTTGMALELAQALGIRTTEATAEGVAFAGTCAPFYPIYADQPLPQVFADNEFDTPSEWRFE